MSKAARALALLRSGDHPTCDSIAREVGLSRQRVWQIAREHGEMAPHDSVRIAIELSLREGDDPLAIKFATPSLVAKVRRELGLPAPRKQRPAPSVERLHPFIEMVREGRSISSVEREHGLTRGKLFKACKRAGVKSVHESRNPSFERPSPDTPSKTGEQR